MDFTKIEQWKQEIVKEARQIMCPSATVFDSFSQINRLHDEIHRYIMEEIENALRTTEKQPTFTYCWVEMGSGGRLERTLWTDQDNGIIFQCDDKDRKKVYEFLTKVAEKVVDSLEKAGYPLCDGRVMANNPLWLQPVEGWKQSLLQWSNNLELDDIRYLLIASDLRPLYGDFELANEIKSEFLEKLKSLPVLHRLAQYSLHQELPIGAFGKLFTKRHGVNAGRFHLKEGGYYQLVSLIRTLSYQVNTSAFSTKERMMNLNDLNYFEDGSAEGWKEALVFFLFLRIRNHLQLFDAGEPVHDFIDLGQLNKEELKELKRHLIFLKKQQKQWLHFFR